MRVGDSVCVKNDGESCILNYQENLTLGHGKYTAEYAMRADRKRSKRAEKDVLQSSKLRRIQRKNERDLLKKTNEKAEGVQYQSNWAFNEVMNHIDKSSEKISEASTNIVYFDLETTGFGCNADILQIAAQKDEEKFNVYIKSSKEISAQATETTGLHKINGNLYLRDKILETTEMTEALKLFQDRIFGHISGIQKTSS
ncbi:uncharacterized protein LOC143906120 [Temnothorax americanus]|uniref:uncharacterized protein LOC143906120 n=1 Tax=Temnothorax americanus TaxID=1964332 RepID=UPI0040697BC1